MYEQSKKHLTEVHESYLEHMAFAMQIAWLMLSGGTLIILHALIPGIFVRSGSSRINRLTGLIRSRQADPGAAHDFTI